MLKNCENKEPTVEGDRLHDSAMMRSIFMVLGGVFFITGIIGIFLPVLPTTGFIILAGACWAKGSTRFHNWLMSYPLFAKMINDWEENRAMPKKAKYLAWSMMALSCGLLFYRLPPHLYWIAIVSSVLCLMVALWMYRLPNS